MYGKEVAEISGIAIKSIYTTLGRMEIRKLVTTEKEKSTKECRALRRFYKITNKGKKSLNHFIKEMDMEVQIAK